MNPAYTKLQAFFRENPRCAIAFSGGADSTFLLHAALACGADAHAYYVKSAFQPAWEHDDVLRFASALGAPLTVLELDVLSSPEIACNDEQRCYHCKHRILSRLIAQAEADGFELLIDGTNASDNENDRPGMRALSELGVLSPLRLYGLTKDDIRRLSRECGLPSAEKPAYACLATRIPTGRPIEQDLLARVEEAENLLLQNGFSDFRLRVRGEDALLQLRACEHDAFARLRGILIPQLQNWFMDITLDPVPR